MKTWVEISKSNLIHNIKEFRRIIGKDVKLMAVVKSNAYGHGLKEVAKIADADAFGVDSIDEALILRKNGVKAPILVLGYTLLGRLEDAVKNKISLTVYNRETIKRLGKFDKKVKVHIKAETGTSRQGIGEEEILDFVKYIKEFSNIQIEGISTHFANIEDTTNHTYAAEQLNKFSKIVELLEKNEVKIPIKHTACSAATILFPETHFDMARVGISMYGLWPSKETLVSALGRTQIVLKPALTWKTIIAQIKKIKKGTPVSYGLTEKTKRDSIVAVIPVGYWDGYDRNLSNIGEVLVKGKRCKILGRICMNMCVVDITDLMIGNRHTCSIEDEVVLLGRQGSEEITAEELSGKIGTINYEVVTRINPLIERVVV